VFISRKCPHNENNNPPPVFSPPPVGDTVGISQGCLVLGKLEWLGDHMLKKV